MSKIGIVILILGIGLGVKYAIDKDLINQLTRIVLGYLAGFGLYGLSVWLKKKYYDYSAILASGALAAMYYTTFVAYNYYALFPQIVAFVIMVITTIAAIYVALQYDKEIIALFGQVGAYAVPFLLSDNSGDEKVLFSYIAIINIGILFFSFKKNWQILYYAAFVITWLLFGSWYFETFEWKDRIYSTLLFAFIFFVIFYITLIISHIKYEKEYEKENLWMLYLNAVVFFSFGLLILKPNNYNNLVDWFPAINAVLHLLAAIVIYFVANNSQKLLNQSIRLAILFTTIAAPFLLKDEFITIFWIFETFILAFFGLKYNVGQFKKYVKLILSIAVVAIIIDWVQYYSINALDSAYYPIWNLTFLTSILMILLLIFIYQKRQNLLNFFGNTFFKTYVINYFYIVPVLLIVVIYCTFYAEIFGFWENKIHENWNQYLAFRAKQKISLINYSFLFLTALAFFNQLKVRSETLALFNFAFTFITIFVFLTTGFEAIENLSGFTWVRYGSYLLFGLSLFSIYQYHRQHYFGEKQINLFLLAFHLSVIALLSLELMHLLDLFGIKDANKLALSILWGVYAFGLMIGIWKRNSQLRFGAIILFAITLIKVLLYDLSELNMISKIIIFLILGVLLLIISYLYNKFKDSLFDA